MIGSIRGMVIDRFVEGELLVDVGGVGYKLAVPTPCLASFGDVGDQVFLHVHTHVRDDAIVLYGFPTREERWCFETLIATHGVGPALAMAILSVHSPSSLRHAVVADEAAALEAVPGVGRKTAARLMMELKTRFEVPEPDTGPDRMRDQPAAYSEIRDALGGLGYAPDEVRLALQALPLEGSAEELLRAALRQLARSG